MPGRRVACLIGQANQHIILLIVGFYDPGLAGLTYDGGPAIFYWYIYHLPSAEKMSVSDCYMHSVY